MNLSDFDIDWNTVEKVDFDPIPKGIYPAKVTESKFQVSKAGDGTMLMLTFTLLGKYNNRKIFETYMFKHPKKKVVDMGLGQVKALALCLGIDFAQLKDTSEFHGIPCGIKIKVESSEKYGDQNKITSFVEYSENLLQAGEENAVEEIHIDDSPDIIPDGDEESSSVSETINTADLPLPSDIKKMSAAKLQEVIKECNLSLSLKGMKVADARQAVTDALFAAEVISDDDEDFVIE